MTEKGESIVILIADDDEDDRMMAQEALEEAKIANNLHFVENGEELLEYLLNQGDYADPVRFPRPGLILLDLNMPKMDGREALKEIKSNPLLRQIPVVVMTTSKAEEDIYRSYDLGVNSFVSKPVSFDGLVEVMRGVTSYWFSIVQLPRQKS